MKHWRSIATAQLDPPVPVSARALARRAGLAGPVSLSGLSDALSAPRTYHAVVTTPSGTALGGTVDLTVFRDGRYTFDVHMHDSGWDPYDFRVRCALTTPGAVLLFQTSGHTDGTGSDLLGDIHRDFDHHEEGANPLIAPYWLDASAADFSVSKSYEDAGLLSAAGDFLKDLLGFLIADVTLGAGLALVVCASADVADALGATFVGTGGLVGVLVAGGVVWMWGPSAIVAAVVAGVAAGAVTDALVQHRQLRDDEYDFAGLVFGDTLPPRDRIYVTNLTHGGGRKYTWPGVDGSVLLNLGEAFDDPVHYADPNSSYTTPGQVFIHELTHAWQFRTGAFIPGLLCKRVFETSSYTPGPPDQAWSDLGLEQQAAVVDQWFGRHAAGWATADDARARLASDAALRDPHFGYIANNIRLGQN